MIGILLILFAWFIEMPLWLSIVTTVVGSLGALAELAEFCSKVRY